MGRRLAFNVCLFVCAIACLVSGAMPTWPSLAFCVAVLGFGGGGGIVLDSTILLEFLPSRKRWVVTMLAIWWGVGQTVGGLIAWPFLSTLPPLVPRLTNAAAPLKWNCQAAEGCTYHDNQGWRFTMYTSGAVVFVMSCLRLTVIRLHETPKFQLAANNDEAVVDTLRALALRYNRPFSLTVEELESCGRVTSAHSKTKISVAEVLVHLRGIFATRKMALSVVLLWAIWAMSGLAAPLYLIFLPWVPFPLFFFFPLFLVYSRLTFQVLPRFPGCQRRRKPGQHVARLCVDVHQLHLWAGFSGLPVQSSCRGTSLHHDHFRAGNNGLLLWLHGGANAGAEPRSDRCPQLRH